MPPADKELIARLPRTFVPALNQQLRQWDLLFPAERRVIRGQLDWLSRLPARDFTALFEPILEIEARMNLPRWKPDAAALSIEDTAILARSPLYAEWRSRVEKIFARLESAVEDSGALKRVPRLLICVLPPGLPVARRTLWRDLDPEVTFHFQLECPFQKLFPALAAAIAGRGPAGLEPVETTWAFECLPDLSNRLQATPAVVLSWEALSALRREFSGRLNAIQKSLKSADETMDELKRIDVAPLIGPPLAANVQVREFIRALLLGGNGGLVFENSFIEWGAAETLRRVEPQALIASFGFRTRPKPFSSAVWLEDQARSNPVPDQPDPEGSLVDAIMLTQYVYLAAQRLAAYRGWTLTLLAAAESDRVTAIAPKDRPTALRGAAGPVTGPNLTAACLAWLGASA